jgi:hypothetical protein
VTFERPQPGVLVLDGLLSDADVQICLPAAQFSIQQLQAGSGRHGLPERREHAHVDDPTIAARLWQRLEPHMPAPRSWFDEETPPRLGSPLEQWRFTGCNERIRYYRYGIGDRFAPHYDEPFRPTADTRTLITILVYLPTAEGSTGGETVVNGTVVPVRPGRIVAFDHRLIHEGRPVERGEKLVLRTDLVASPGTRGAGPLAPTRPT